MSFGHYSNGQIDAFSWIQTGSCEHTKGRPISLWFRQCFQMPYWNAIDWNSLASLFSKCLLQDFFLKIRCRDKIIEAFGILEHIIIFIIEMAIFKFMLRMKHHSEL